MSGEVKENKMGVMPVNKLLLSMAVPMMISMLVQAMYNIVDSIFVAKLSEEALTAVSLAFPLQSLMISVCTGLCVGMNALLSRYLGAKDSEGVNKSALNGLLLIFIGYLIFLFVGLFLIPTFMYAQTPIESIAEQGITYTKIVSICSIAFFSQMAFERLLQATGRTLYTMCTQTTGAVINIILDPIMIFGLGPFPAMGIQGAALATGIGQTITLIIYFIFYFASPIQAKFRISLLKSGKRLLKKLYSIGVPAMLNMALPSLLITALNGILSEFSGSYVLVLGVYYKLQTFIYLTANGLIQGIRPIIGYNCGAGEHKRVKQIYNTALLLSAIIMALGTALSWIMPSTLFGMFTANPATLKLGVTALNIISIGFIVSAVSVTSSGALEGLGKGLPSLWISLFRYIIIIIPAAFVFSRFFGAVGVWISFPFAEFVTAVFAYFIYHKASRRI